MSYLEKIIQLIENKKTTKEKIANEIGSSRATFYNYLNCSTKCLLKH